MANEIRLRVLIIEDDDFTANALRLSLERAGMAVHVAGTGEEAIAAVPVFLPQIVLIDLELPDCDGIDLVRWLNEHHNCGKIIVSGKAEESERLIGLELGADDYIVKPPSMRELIARIRAVHRRTSPAELPEGDAAPRSAFASGTPNTVFGGVSIDLKQRVASAADGEQIPLTGTEFDVLAILVEQAGNVVSRDFLSKAVLRRDYSPSDRSLDQLVHRIRAKLAAEDPSYQIIQSVRGVGYRLVAPKTT